jgi:hypothetical protein
VRKWCSIFPNFWRPYIQQPVPLPVLELSLADRYSAHRPVAHSAPRNEALSAEDGSSACLIGDYFNGESLSIADSFLARPTVGHHTGEFQGLGNPAAVTLPADLDGKVHPFILSPARTRYCAGV